jgi:KUP system potassium uptake protein
LSKCYVFDVARARGLHDRVVLLTVVTERRPHVSEEERIAVEDLGKRISRVTVRFGFAEQPALPPVLSAHAERLGRETPVPTTRPHLALWREKLFIIMTRNAVSASDYFQIPPGRVVELGTQVEL